MLKVSPHKSPCIKNIVILTNNMPVSLLYFLPICDYNFWFKIPDFVLRAKLDKTPTSNGVNGFLKVKSRYAPPNPHHLHPYNLLSASSNLCQSKLICETGTSFYLPSAICN